MPNCLSSNQLKCLCESLLGNSDNNQFSIMSDWFYPYAGNISFIRSTKKNGLNGGTYSNVYNSRRSIRLNFQSMQSIKDLLLKFSINKLKKQTSRSADQQQQQQHQHHQQRFGNNNFNLFTYFVL